MVMAVPFLPTSAWMALRLKALLEGAEENEAIAAANRGTGLRGKDFARATIRAAGGATTLSIPIEGGAKSLTRRHGPEEAEMSSHGNWRHVHLGAFEATYGRSPFFSDLFPGLKRVYATPATRLADFNRRLLDELDYLTGLRETLSLRGRYPLLPPPVMRRGEELMEEMGEKSSILDAIMRLGPETMLPLLALYQGTTLQPTE